MIEAEVWGLYFGLQLALEEGISKLIIESDFDLAVLLLNQYVQDIFHPLATLLKSCRDNDEMDCAL